MTRKHLFRERNKALILFLIILTACNHHHEHEGVQSITESEFLVPQWAVNATIYQANIRHFTEDGTINAFAEHIPRLEEMGVRILWLMPVYPIGELNRKGSLGNVFSISNFREINPEFGTKEDFKAMIEKAHAHGMKVIMSWVASYTSWDAEWTQTHPEFYLKDESGNFYSSQPDWEDVIQLDVNNREMWDAMSDDMFYWADEFHIDGFSAHWAHMIPLEFWIETRAKLEDIKPMFMLADTEDPEYHRAFDMTYASEFTQIMRDIGAGKADLSDLDIVMESNFERFKPSDYRMYFTNNHELNTYKGSDLEFYGENFKNFAVKSATIWGMPLVFNGQETGLDRVLNVYDKDEIEWGNVQHEDFYRTLLDLNSRNQALFNGEIGGRFKKMPTDKDQHIYSYKRIGHHEQVLVVMNFSNDEQTFTFLDGHTGTWKNVFDDTEKEIHSTMTIGANRIYLLERVYMSH